MNAPNIGSSPAAGTEKGNAQAGINRPLLFFLFFVSGFSSLVYQVVWTRLAFASFGIITPVLSVVLSVFMLGLSLGSWLGGQWIGRAAIRTRLSPVSIYGMVEFGIGIGAFAVPRLFRLGEAQLLTLGGMDSGRYLFFSALVLGLVILPWCVGMGATFPLMMAYIRDREPAESSSFSYLYLANVLGAMTGTVLTALVLVECLGFHHTLRVAATGNFLIAAISLALGARGRRPSANLEAESGQPAKEAAWQPPNPARRRWIQWVLFSTGLGAMAMEVVWTRAFAPVVKTEVYSFALIVATYLGATFLGSWLYRRGIGRSRQPSPSLVYLVGISALLPVLVNDPRFIQANWTGRPEPISMIFLLASICPFCALLGYLTPGLVDEYPGGAPAMAGKAYAINVLGCIIGPLLASYIMMPWINERHALVLLSLPFAALYFAGRQSGEGGRAWLKPALGGAVLLIAIFVSNSYEEYLFRVDPHAEVRRDYAASVMSFTDSSNGDKHLLVNGVGMTTLTPITKFMADLPMAFHEGRPESALLICFGMGTTFRSSLSWDVPTTAVELIPSVPQAFGFYHPDAGAVLRNPLGKIVIDDGRRFLGRTGDRFDVIVIDPPPPVEAAGSSLLYSTKFYEAAKRRLKPNGILQAWFPGNRPGSPVGRTATFQAAARSVQESFPYVRCYRGLGKWGYHMLASMQPIPDLTPAQVAARMPPKAIKDLLEWTTETDPAAYLNQVLAQEISMDTILKDAGAQKITDDQPYNEYFLLREVKARFLTKDAHQ